jgi:hypothetical protein
MPSSFRSRSPVSLSIVLAAVIAIAGALFVVTRMAGGVPTNTVELAAAQSRKSAKCPAVSTKKVNAWSKTGTYVDRRGVTQHHDDGAGTFVPTGCAIAAPTVLGAGNTTKAGQAQTVNCPTVKNALPAIPASAQAEVTRNLALLDTQIGEANARLAQLAVKPEGGANFIQNAIIGPLKDKRAAVLERIAISIGRTAAKPTNLGGLAACTLNNAAAGGAAAGGAAAGGAAAGGAANGGAANGGAANGGNAAATTAPAAPATQAPLDILAKDCSQSKLAPHDGFQNGNRCVSTSFGELAEAAQNPSLLIQDAPTQINAGQTFTIAVSTRNLVRDRFLAAGQGGYYVESSLLNNQGLVRGHFHTACRMLKGNEAQDPAPAPAFFVATEDGGGGATPDTVKITVAGLTTPGTAQCASWAGDGSHRVPMMQRANQTPAFDVVRIQVK